MDSNPHYEILAGERMEPAHGIIHAILAVAFEQRTANLIAAQATPGWLDEVRERLGHPTAATPPTPEERDQRCNKPFLDGRMEVRCWAPKDHEGECT